MAVDLVIAPEAEADLDQAFSYYEARQVGLGGRFLDHVARTIREVVHLPESHRTISKDYRRALVRRFPYGIFYEIGDNTVTVYGVFHTAINPDKWQRRLP